MSQRRVLPEDERRELRIWMRKKQRERLAVYHKHRESLKERERKPFSTSGTTVRQLKLLLALMLNINVSTLLIISYVLAHYRNLQTKIKHPF